MKRPLMTLAAFLIPGIAQAQVALSNLPVTPSSVTIELDSGFDSGTTFAEVVDEPFSVADTMGTLSGRIEAFEDRLEVRMDGVVTSPSSSGVSLSAGCYFALTTTLPNLGDAQTPVYITSQVSSPDSAVRASFQAESANGISLRSRSFSSPLRIHSLPITRSDTGAIEDQVISQFTAPAGDTISMLMEVRMEIQVRELTTGPFSATGTLAFKVPPAVLSTGDYVLATPRRTLAAEIQANCFTDSL